MSIKDNLNHAVSEKDLLRHPFYQAWSAGTLPAEALQTYAREYGAFIGMLPRAWETLHDAETAREEHEHAILWEQFALALGTETTRQASLPEVRALAATAARLFAHPASAAGALYAFEVQQPATASSKLSGLRAHYALPVGSQRYFEIHSHNEHEAQKLAARIASLSPEDQAQAVQACSEMAGALWNALTGIHGMEKLTPA
ncbi:MAG TPA: iron-containing redox enzyme family protein [Anaerolineales bacterium]|nr:iron-containing redox enzyme family protein [Anaerolineales bacterium]